MQLTAHRLNSLFLTNSELHSIWWRLTLQRTGSGSRKGS